VWEPVINLTLGEANTSNQLVRNVDDGSDLDLNWLVWNKILVNLTLKLLFVASDEE